MDVPPFDGRPYEPMPEQAEVIKGKRDFFRKEDPSYIRWHVRKGIPHASNHKVLKRRRFLDERRLPIGGSKVPLLNEVVRQLRAYNCHQRSES